MITVSYVYDSAAVDKLSNNKAWLETYIPVVSGRLRNHGIEVRIDETENFDILHIHLPLPLAQRMLKSDKPKVFHGHATEETFMVGTWTRYWVRRLLLHFAKNSDIIICPSSSAAEYYRKHLPDKKIAVMSYGIDLEKYEFRESERKKFRERFGISDDDIVISCVGGFSKRKGIVEFFNVAKSLPDCRFMWVGGDYTHNTAVNLFYKIFAHAGEVSLKNLPPNVILTGYTREVPAALSASDIFFFPSKQETLGLALVEAAACSLPLVVSDIPVFREWLSDGEDCLMGTTEKKFAVHIAALVANPELRQKLGKKARLAAEKHHDINSTAQELAGLYKSLL
ncbi:MAG TPA: glycosyltransferase family 4 protein [Candidatus Methanoperedenaceae archaeon]|nr:glycosyltransferase family 4 protein [Candidatus Methanoperedenaceae archaeon]